MRVPNYKLDGEIARMRDFTNYNGTITGQTANGVYTVRHWNTTVAVYSHNERAVWLYGSFISQTTSTLLGRIVRSLPDRQAVIDAIALMPKQDARRFKAMLNR